LRPQVLQTTFHEALVKAADNDQTYLATRKALLKGDSKVDTNFSIEKDWLRYKNRWYIPKDEGLRRTIMEAEHDTKIAGHFGTDKTIGRVRANFYWPKMDEQITEYVRSCDVCQRNMVIRHKKYGLLEPWNDPTIGCYNHYHLSPNDIPSGNQRWYGLVYIYIIQMAGKA